MRVRVRGGGVKVEVGILIVLLSADEGDCENSVEWDIMQV